MTLQKKMTIIGRKITVPQTVLKRRLLGTVLLFGGALSFLPILGIWMAPVGFVYLSYDSPKMRRVRRKTESWLGRKWQKWKKR